MIALKSKNEIITRNLRIIRKNLKIASEFFQKHNETFDWIAPSSGSVAFPKLKGAKIDDFCLGLLKRRDTMLLPGTVFDSQDNRFRIGLGKENFPEALKQLGTYVDQYGQSKSKTSHVNNVRNKK
jgi:aspartate/methionine/tyrosine aminotransferase